jgi:hypothetical protein
MTKTLNIGQEVSINGVGRYKILEIINHGKGLCDCCPKAEAYRMYRLDAHYIINEDQVLPYIGN